MRYPIRRKILYCFVLLIALLLFGFCVLFLQMNASISRMQTHAESSEAVSGVISNLRNMDRSLQKYIYTENDSYLGDYCTFFAQLQRSTPVLAKYVNRNDTTNAVRNTKVVIEQYIEQYSSYSMQDLKEATPLMLNGMEDNLNYTLDSVIYSSSRKTTRDMMDDYKDYQRMQLMIAAVIASFCVMAVLLALNLTKRLTRPIVELTQKMNCLAEGNFQVEKTHINTDDEIQVIGDKFNEMTDAIKNYVNEINRLSVEQQRAIELENAANLMKLKTLQAQISPHFLYNTLNAGAALAIQEDADKTGEFLVHLSKLFRYNLMDISSDTTLKEELTHVGLYVDLINLRYAGRINYIRQVEEDCLNVVMPRMILQPIVENSILHGLSPSAPEMELVISGKRNHNCLEVEIYDNGNGMSRSIIDTIMAGGSEGNRNQSTGLGLGNIIGRLKLFYSSEDVVRIESVEGAYTKVILTIPLPV